MGGGRKPKSTANVVLGVPKPKHKNGSQVGSIGVGGNGGISDVSPNRCKAFYLHKPKTTIVKLVVGTSVFAVMNGRSVEVKSSELGTIGIVPPGTAAQMIREGQNLYWAGEVVEIDKDRLSIKITLCPTQ